MTWVGAPTFDQPYQVRGKDHLQPPEPPNRIRINHILLRKLVFWMVYNDRHDLYSIYINGIYRGDWFKILSLRKRNAVRAFTHPLNRRAPIGIYRRILLLSEPVSDTVSTLKAFYQWRNLRNDFLPSFRWAAHHQTRVILAVRHLQYGLPGIPEHRVLLDYLMQLPLPYNHQHHLQTYEPRPPGNLK